MDNIGDIINSVLSDPEAVAKLKETAKQLGLDGDNGGDSSQLPNSQPAAKAESSSPASPDLLSAINQLVPMLGKMQQEDDMSRLIHALKPYLSGNRLKKAEEADKIMAVMRLIPLLKNAQQQNES